MQTEFFAACNSVLWLLFAVCTGSTAVEIECRTAAADTAEQLFIVADLQPTATHISISFNCAKSCPCSRRSIRSVCC